MASERQIAANRLNARKSTGPRSTAGKRRSSRNAYWHGLSSSDCKEEHTASQIEQLVQQIIEVDQVSASLARTIAEEHFALARIARVRAAMVERAGKLAKRVSGPLGELNDMPASSDKDDSMGAIRSALPELVKLERYERRTVSARDGALRSILKEFCRS
jgi:hypothetical protein